MNTKLLVLLTCPCLTRSGYGSRSRDIATALIKSDKYDVRIFPTNWGATPFTGLDLDDPNHLEIHKRLMSVPQLERKPDISIQITIPNEFQQWGVVNIGITAGIETDHVDASWIDGCNRMDLVLVSSNHAKSGFVNTVYNKVDQNNNPIGEQLRLTTRMEVLFEGLDIEKYFKKSDIDPKSNLATQLKSIKEPFVFLFTGHWLNGTIGQDRKDVGMLIKVFLEVFKNKKNKPALLLKTSTGNNSIVDRFEILKRIEEIKATCSSKDLPNVYLIHGDLTDSEMNDLYNYSKVKAHITFTKGEGFGRPILESSVSAKPIIAPEHSGYLDFLEFFIKLPGRLTEIHPSAVWEGVLNKGTNWFTVDYNFAGGLLRDVYENYSKYSDLGKRQAYKSSKNFTLDQMQEKLIEYIDSISNKIPKQIELVMPDLPVLKKVTE